MRTVGVDHAAQAANTVLAVGDRADDEGAVRSFAKRQGDERVIDRVRAADKADIEGRAPAAG